MKDFAMYQPAPPMEGDRVIISNDLAGDVTLAGWENVEIALDTGRVINTHHIHLEPHPVQDGMWYYTLNL